jgi:hypothetical protein
LILKDINTILVLQVVTSILVENARLHFIILLMEFGNGAVEKYGFKNNKYGFCVIFVLVIQV